MYQFDRSSAYDSKAATTPGVQKRSYSAVASRTSCAVRAASQPSSPRGSSPAAPGANEATRAYVTKNAAEFQNRSSRRFTSSAIP